MNIGSNKLNNNEINKMKNLKVENDYFEKIYEKYKDYDLISVSEIHWDLWLDKIYNDVPKEELIEFCMKINPSISPIDHNNFGKLMKKYNV
jgi:hypothetical protein